MPKHLAQAKAASARKSYIRPKSYSHLMTLLRLTLGQQHEVTAFALLMEHGVMQRCRGGHSKRHLPLRRGQQEGAQQEIRPY